ncbi:MAG: cation:dicarboxylase symporter family transporter [Bacteroidetes bacterium]|nr:cation:dicarboxylase symporter family transporter [Bacteroidota bacterium]
MNVGAPSAGQNTGKLAVRVLIGAVLGILTGLIIGDYAAYLEFLGKAYVQLLAMCVYPYLVASLLHGLGKMDSLTARLMLKRGWFIFALAWVIILAAMMVLSLVFPKPLAPVAIVNDSANRSVDFVSIFVPGNIFSDLSKNYIPAVVAFTMLYGVAIQKVNHKDTLLNLMETVKSASLTIWNWVVWIAPLGVFALFANVAGTMMMTEIEGLLLYIIVFLVGSALFTFWILPLLITSMVPLKYRELMKELEGAFVLALVTTLSVAALPIITQAIEKFLRDRNINDSRMNDVVGTNISLAYPFAQLGNLGVLLFIYFCNFFYKLDFTLAQKILLPPLTLVSTIGTPSAAVNAINFLSVVFKVPPGTEDLYAATTIFTRYGQVALSVMGFVFTALLATFSFYGKLKFNPRKFFTPLGAGIIVLLGFTLVLRTFSPGLFKERNLPYLQYRLPGELRAGVSAVIYRPGQPRPHPDYDSAVHFRLDRIRRTGVLQVGYNPGIIPFCYFNNAGELVGYDVENMYRLARDLNVKLQFIPFEWGRMEEDLMNHEFDIAIGGIFVTNERLQALPATRPYFQSPLALLARGAIARDLTTREKVLGNTKYSVGTFTSPVLIRISNVLFPENHKVLLDNYFELASRTDIDFAIWTFEQARAYAMTHPGFTAVIPADFGSPLLIAYFMPPDALPLVRYMDYWLQIKDTEGTTAMLKKRWMEGVQTRTQDHRWCLIRDVFHWGNS